MTVAREDVVASARAWLRTPYLSNAMVKGAGVDCAMLLVAVFQDVGIVPKDFDPRPYPPQWHLHRDVELYLNIVQRFLKEISIPSGPGDVVLFKIGRIYAHGGIITDWPRIIHSQALCPVSVADISKHSIGKHALSKLPMRFFTAW